MHAKIVILVFFVGAALAYPTEEFIEIDNEVPVHTDVHLMRAKRQFNMQGGGSPKQGFNVDANARFPIWQSQNQRNSVHGTAGYSQHLGGPYGNSRPDVRGGIQFTHRF